MTRRAGLLSCLVTFTFVGPLACQPMGAPIAPSDSAPNAPNKAEMQVITADQAAEHELVGADLLTTYDGADAQDGTEMILRWLDAAKRRGARYVGKMAMYVVQPGQDGGLVECRTAFYPRDTVVPHDVPGRTDLVGITRPVQRSVTHYEQRCHMVSKPVMETETTYQSQYDSFSKSYRSVPQTRSVTRYRMQNECRSEPVTRSETHWEYTTQTRFIPPRTEMLVERRLTETEPVCHVAAEGAVSRVEGKTYTAKP